MISFSSARPAFRKLERRRPAIYHPNSFLFRIFVVSKSFYLAP